MKKQERSSSKEVHSKVYSKVVQNYSFREGLDESQNLEPFVCINSDDYHNQTFTVTTINKKQVDYFKLIKKNKCFNYQNSYLILKLLESDLDNDTLLFVQNVQDNLHKEVIDLIDSEKLVIGEQKTINSIVKHKTNFLGAIIRTKEKDLTEFFIQKSIITNLVKYEEDNLNELKKKKYDLQIELDMTKRNLKLNEDIVKDKDLILSNVLRDKIISLKNQIEKMFQLFLAEKLQNLELNLYE